MTLCTLTSCILYFVLRMCVCVYVFDNLRTKGGDKCPSARSSAWRWGPWDERGPATLAWRLRASPTPTHVSGSRFALQLEVRVLGSTLFVFVMFDLYVVMSVFDATTVSFYLVYSNIIRVHWRRGTDLRTFLFVIVRVFSSLIVVSSASPSSPVTGIFTVTGSSQTVTAADSSRD